jgi:hypothetical protein
MSLIVACFDKGSNHNDGNEALVHVLLYIDLPRYRTALMVGPMRPRC